jgi:sigma-E factor negative regulatory protein RseC
MIESGTIISIENEFATVKIHRGEECESCHLCDSFGSNEMKLVALNEAEAGIGDIVDIKVEPGKVIKHSFLIFILPIIAMIFGYWIGVTLVPEPGGEKSGIVGAFIALLLVFMIIRLYNRHYSRNEKCAAKIIGYSSDHS